MRGQKAQNGFAVTLVALMVSADQPNGVLLTAVVYILRALPGLVFSNTHYGVRKNFSTEKPATSNNV